MSLARTFAAFVAVLALACPAAAIAQGATTLVFDPGELHGSDSGHGRVTVGFQTIHTDGNLDGDGNAFPGATTDAHSLTLAIDWHLARGWWLHASLPYVDKRSQGDPGFHNPDRLTQPHPDSQFLDDGDYHGAWQDWQLGVSYQGYLGGWEIWPHAVLTLPSHDYTFFASAAPGQQLRKLRFGVDVSHRLGRSNVHLSGGYAYEFVEEVLGTNVDKQHARASLHWDVSPTWSLNTFANYRQGNGKKPSDFFGRPQTTETWYHHDQLLQHNYLLAGIGANWQIGDRWMLSGSSAWPIQADSMHRVRYAWDLQLSRSF